MRGLEFVYCRKAEDVVKLHRWGSLEVGGPTNELGYEDA